MEPQQGLVNLLRPLQVHVLPRPTVSHGINIPGTSCPRSGWDVILLILLPHFQPFPAGAPGSQDWGVTNRCLEMAWTRQTPKWEAVIHIWLHTSFNGLA